MRRTARSLMAAAVVLSLLPGAARAAGFEIDPAHSTVGFRIRHLVSRVNGSFGTFTGTIELDEKQWAKSRVEVNIEAASINTQNTRRDEHLRGSDFFEVTRYPAISFKSKRVQPAGKGRLKVLGDLTMHGVTKPITLNASYLGQTDHPRGGKAAGFSATAKVNRKDFGILWNRALDKGGAMLGDEVEILLEIEAIQKK